MGLSSPSQSSASLIDDADVAAGQHRQRQRRQQQQQQQHLFQKQQQQQRLKEPMDNGVLLDDHNKNKNIINNKTDDIAIAPYYYETPPMSGASMSSATSVMSTKSMSSTISINGRPEDHPSDLEFFEDLVSEPVLVLGVDISHLSRQGQFCVCAVGVFGFSLLYGYLQELISVQLCNRQLGLFLASVQFSGYTILASILRNFVYSRQQKSPYFINKQAKQKQQQSLSLLPSYDNKNQSNSSLSDSLSQVPLHLYLGLSLLRAIDLGMTNLAMQYINYPAKTLMKSSRVVFTMIFGVVIARKSYQVTDYAIVFCMVAGLALFMHADANSSAVFDLLGVAMLTVSLLCDGAISNMSETIMTTFGVGQDEFIFRMYSIALVAITFAAAVKGDLREGLLWMSQPGTYDELLTLPAAERSWSVVSKVTVMVLFSSMGFFGSSCSAAITKNFGALTMSITSTARKATTLFLSFFLFNNVCTWEHLLGVAVFITALTAKSLRRRKHSKSSSSRRKSSSSKKKKSRTKRINEQWKHTMEQHYNKNNNSNVSVPSSMESMAMASGLVATTSSNSSHSTNTSTGIAPAASAAAAAASHNHHHHDPHAPAAAVAAAAAAAAPPIPPPAPLDVVLDSSGNDNSSIAPSPGRSSSTGMTQRRSHLGGGAGSPKLAHAHVV